MVNKINNINEPIVGGNYTMTTRKDEDRIFTKESPTIMNKMDNNK